ncbi:TIGR04372 family glycosyltransferase [Candidatus Omnitrophota bacterium]
MVNKSEQKQYSLKAGIAKIASYLNIAICVPISFIRVLCNFSLLRKVEIIVFMAEGGFGHTITGPDLMRRLFKGKRCAFIAFSEFNRHNRKVARIWPDIFYLFLPLSTGVKFNNRAVILPLSAWYKRTAPQLIIRLLRIFNKSFELYDNEDIYKLTAFPDGFDAKRSIPKSLIGKDWCNSCVRVVGYLKLINDVSVPEVRLPEKWRTRVRNKIEHLLSRGTDAAKLCGLYLRQKGIDSGDVTSSIRCGSKLEIYLAAIRYLNEKGYAVLLTGDESMADAVREEFQGNLIDDKSIRIDKGYFDLFAAIESDIFICESGGGAWLPGLNNVPRLMTNSFPLGCGLQNSWVFYKTIREKNGQLVSDIKKTFIENEYQYNFEDYAVDNNNSEELLSAVASFLEDIKKPKDYNPGAEIVSRLSDTSWIKQSGAKISPAWLRLYSYKEGKCVKV